MNRANLYKETWITNGSTTYIYKSKSVSELIYLKFQQLNNFIFF